MATKTMSVEPLIGSNYPTWKLQCQMTLMRDGLWELVDGSEVEPDTAELRLKYKARKQRALGTIVLMISTQLHYLLGTPTCPAEVWTTLANQFQRKSWPNVLERRRKLHSLRLTEGESVQAHLKQLTELLDELSIVDAPVKLDDRVMYLLESLPDSMAVLVTALQANIEIPTWSVVVEKLLHEESKLKTRAAVQTHKLEEDALAARKAGRHPSCNCHHGKADALAARDTSGVRCYRCGKMGHYKRECTSKQPGWSGDHRRGTPPREGRRGNYGAVVRREDSSDEEPNMMLCHALTAKSLPQDDWILDSGASSHMCNNHHLIQEFSTLSHGVKVTGTYSEQLQ